MIRITKKRKKTTSRRTVIREVSRRYKSPLLDSNTSQPLSEISGRDDNDRTRPLSNFPQCGAACALVRHRMHQCRSSNIILNQGHHTPPAFGFCNIFVLLLFCFFFDVRACAGRAFLAGGLPYHARSLAENVSCMAGAQIMSWKIQGEDQVMKIRI